MTLLEIIQEVCELVSLPRPTTIISSPDQQIRQLYAIANEEGRNQAGSFDWQIMRAQYDFTTVASAVQSSAVPDDWDRFISNSFFNITTRRQIVGPITPQEWQAIQAQPQLNRVVLAFVQRGGQFLLTPTPTAGETIQYEYVSKNWAVSNSGEPKSRFTADTDETYLSDDVMILGIRWRWYKAKGLEYGDDLETYREELRARQARDGGNTVIDAAPSGRLDFPIGAGTPQGFGPQGAEPFDFAAYYESLLT